MKLFMMLGLLTCSLAVVNCSAGSIRDSKTNPQNEPRSVAGQENKMPVKNVVIVHGAFADSSGWEKVSGILSEKGYHVTLVQNPLVSLDADVAATKKALAKQDGPAVLVGHSYGGAVITQAGIDPKVKSLVYVAAYVPDVGESVGDLLASADKGVPAPPIVIDGKKGIAFIDPAKFAEAFAADVAKIDPATVKYMAENQIPLGLPAVGTKLTEAAWRTKPSYYVVATEDHMIPPSDERGFANKLNAVQKFEIDGSHAVFMLHADQVAEIIMKAASY